MRIAATVFAHQVSRTLDLVEHHEEIVEVLRYGRVVARLVPASATVVLADQLPTPSVVPLIEIPGETAGNH